jgi:hypothetical protein
MTTIRTTLALLFPLALAACAEVVGPTHDAADGEVARAAAAPVAAAAGVCLDYNVPPVGTQWGGPPIGTPVGSTIFVESGIRASVHTFNDGFTTFYGLARVESPPPQPFGVGPVGLARGISYGFDFTGLPFVPQTVTFEWLDQGAGMIENLRVNGSPLFIGQIHTPPAAWGGTAVASAWGPVPNGLRGQITLTGSVFRILVGGQLLWVDRVCAYP